MDGFPLYWTKKQSFKGAQRVEDLPPPDQEVCEFLISLNVVLPQRLKDLH